MNMMDGYRILLPIIVLGLFVVAVRWQFDWTIEKATSTDNSHIFPVSTPFTSPVCGVNNWKCKDLKLDLGFEGE
jgi:hypothetical protein